MGYQNRKSAKKNGGASKLIIERSQQERKQRAGHLSGDWLKMGK